MNAKLTASVNIVGAMNAQMEATKNQQQLKEKLQKAR